MGYTILYMMEKIQATIIRDFGGKKGSWILVGYRVGKDISRKEGLEIKNRYHMVPAQEHGMSIGYKGEVPLEAFEGGKMHFEKGKLVPFDKDEYLTHAQELVL